MSSSQLEQVDSGLADFLNHGRSTICFFSVTLLWPCRVFPWVFMWYLGVSHSLYSIYSCLGGRDLFLDVAEWYGSSFLSLFFGPYGKRGIVGFS